MFNAEEYKQKIQQANSFEEVDRVPLPVIRNDQNYIFVSYSHKDYKQVYSDLADMYEGGVRFWYDRGLQPGKDWDATVLEKMKDPHCCGVIFYLSKNLFLSASIKKEISIATGIDEITGEKDVSAKPYFSVNLTQQLPSRLLFSLSPEEWDSCGMNSRWVTLLMQSFSDESTYLTYSARNHKTELIDAIRDTFNVVNDAKETATSVWMREGEYSGQMMEGKRHGKGVLLYHNGQKYDGDWEYDLRSGEGTLSYNGKTLYRGGWKNDEYHGYGVYNRNHQYYEGQFQNGKRHGHGRLDDDTGDIYSGNWVEDRFHGYGICRYDNGDTYSGQWIEDQWHGEGVYQYDDGKTWSGEFCKGKFWNGEGCVRRYQYGDLVETYEGELRNGKYHGEGVLIRADGSKIEATFQNGKSIEKRIVNCCPDR